MNTKRPKIAIFLKDLAGGGAERSMVNLAAGLADQGYAVDMVLAKAEGPYLSQLSSKVRLVDLKAKRTIASLPTLANYLRTEQPDALLSAMEHANVTALLAKKMSGLPIRTVISIRNTLSQESKGQSLKKRLEPVAARLFYRQADAIVAVSAGVADDLANVVHLPRTRIQVINNPVVSEDLLTKANDPADHPWFADGKANILLAVGRLNQQKDYPTLLRALAKVRSKHDARLLILGEGDDRASLEALVSELDLTDVVSMPGFADNPFAYMSKARLFVMSSKFEGLPGVMIQALACGAPVVSTDCPSGPNEILENGKYGALVPVGDVDALAAAISRDLDGEKVRPPRESWSPFELDAATTDYARVLIPSSSVRASDPSLRERTSVG